MCLLPEQPQLALTLQSKALAPQISHRLIGIENIQNKNGLVSHCLSSTHVLSVTKGYSRITVESNLVKTFKPLIPTRLKA